MSASETAFLIRPVRPEEYEALGELLVEAFGSLPPLMPDLDDYNRHLRDVARRATTSCVLVATTPAGELLGGVTYVNGPEDPYSQDLRQGESGMRMLGVDPAHRSGGVGRALTEACLERARAAGRSRLILYTGSWMVVAWHLYESIGFHRVPDRDLTDAPGVDMLAYAFDLAAEA
jgi:ribosomal protein S18 acetylase RimI-like enzyme